MSRFLDGPDAHRLKDVNIQWLECTWYYRLQGFAADMGLCDTRIEDGARTNDVTIRNDDIANGTGIIQDANVYIGEPEYRPCMLPHIRNATCQLHRHQLKVMNNRSTQRIVFSIMRRHPSAFVGVGQRQQHKRYVMTVTIAHHAIRSKPHLRDEASTPKQASRAPAKPPRCAYPVPLGEPAVFIGLFRRP